MMELTIYLISRAAGIGITLWLFLKIPHWILSQSNLLDKALEILPVGEFGIYLYALLIEAFLIVITYTIVGYVLDTYHYNLRQEKEKQLFTEQNK